MAFMLLILVMVFPLNYFGNGLHVTNFGNGPHITNFGNGPHIIHFGNGLPSY